MRAARSSSEVNTTARPSFSNSVGSAAERLRMAPLGRERAEQRDEAALRLERVGERLDDARGRRRRRLGAASRSPSVSPVTVMQSRWSSGFSSRSTAPMPPAAKRSSM